MLYVQYICVMIAPCLQLEHYPVLEKTGMSPLQLAQDTANSTLDLSASLPLLGAGKCRDEPIWSGNECEVLSRAAISGTSAVLAPS